MKKLIIFLILSSVTTVFADDLIVDKNSLNQYEQDNYAHFNSFNFHGEYQGNNANIPPKPIYISDRINLPGTTPVLGNQFTLEVMVYSKTHPNLPHRTIIGDDSQPHKNDRERPPTITINKVNGVNQIRYGFGVGPSSKGKRRIINSVINDDTWHHVAFTFDGTTTKLYVDGNEVDSSDFASGLTPHPVPISIIGNKFLGKIDEVRIWNVARSISNIQNNKDITVTNPEMTRFLITLKEGLPPLFFPALCSSSRI